jgi:hypothetical protein
MEIGLDKKEIKIRELLTTGPFLPPKRVPSNSLETQKSLRAKVVFEQKCK